MNRFALLAFVLPCFLGACASTSSMPVPAYENDNLISMRHNKHNGYTLLTYRDPLGQVRQVVRKKGVCEMVITYSVSGDVTLKARGEDVRHLQPTEAIDLTRRIKALLRERRHTQPAAPPQPRSIV